METHKEEVHAWFYEPGQKPTAEVIGFRTKLDVVLLNGHSVKLSSEYLVYTYSLVTIALSLGQRTCYLQ